MRKQGSACGSFENEVISEMRAFRSSFTNIKRMIVIVLSLVTAMTFMLPLTAYAQESGKTVRVGWYESPFNMTDQFERRSGYALIISKKSLPTPDGAMST